jgi:hypothetical protein
MCKCVSTTFVTSRGPTPSAQLRPYLLFRFDAKRDLPAAIGMQRTRLLEQMRALSGIDDDQAILMLDQPGIGRQPAGPIAIGGDGQHAKGIRSAPFNLRGLDPNPAGLNGMHLHRD